MTGRPLWTAAEAGQALGLQADGDWSASGVSIDSRTLQPGDLFVALVGPRADGHDHVAEAFAKGAVAALVARRPDGVAPAAPLLTVADTLTGLIALGQAARRRSAAKIVAVTGSCGKTGTKEALRLVLDHQAGGGPCHASAASHNNHWGVPLSLARLHADAAYGVFEVGMNHAGEITPLSLMIRPHVAVITNVEAVHLAQFASVEAIADAKAEIFAGVEPGGWAVLNRDNPHFERLARHAADAGIRRIIGFGHYPTAAVLVEREVLHPEVSCVKADVAGTAITYKVGQPGRHWVMNSLAVLAAVTALGGDLGRAGPALAKLAPLAGRGARHRVRVGGAEIQVLDDSYNANPSSIQAAFETLGRIEPAGRGRRIAVLGDMLELGPEAPALHAALAGPLVANGIDLAFLAGPNMAALDAALPPERRGGHVASSAELVPVVRPALRPGDVVLVKGSLGSRMGPVVEALLGLDDAVDQAVNG